MAFLFPEVARRMREFCESNPVAAERLQSAGIGSEQTRTASGQQFLKPRQGPSRARDCSDGQIPLAAVLQAPRVLQT